MIEWPTFFPNGACVLALPSWEAPRLFVQAHNARQRWQHSSLYPAFRLRARLFRQSLRVLAVLGMGARARTVAARRWPLGTFVADVLPQTASVAVLLGTPGPAQKIVVQLWDDCGDVVGYLKYGWKRAAQRRLHREQRVLSQIPTGLGPQILKFGQWQDGTALLTAPLDGGPVAASLPPPPALAAFLQRLGTSEHVDLAQHPWRKAHPCPEAVAPYLEPLAGRPWPVVVRHGDLAPWNMKYGSNHALQAFDWEYGSLQGFPYLDRTYYVLQLAYLIHRWSPAKARRYAAMLLAGTFALSPGEAVAVTRLTAFEAHRQFACDGHAPTIPSQQWWYTVFSDSE